MDVTRLKRMTQLLKGYLSYTSYLDGNNRRGPISVNAIIKQLKGIACRIVSKFQYANMQKIKTQKNLWKLFQDIYHFPEPSMYERSTITNRDCMILDAPMAPYLYGSA